MEPLAQYDNPFPEGIDDTYEREWVPEISQKVDAKGKLMFEKQSAKDRKAGIPLTPILNFPAGGYWQFSKGDDVQYQVPSRYTDHITGEDYTGSRADKTSVPAKEKQVKFAREYLEVGLKAMTQRLFDEDMKQYEGQETIDWTKRARFEGDTGFAQDVVQGEQPGVAINKAPRGYYYKRDEFGDDIWKDGRRVPAPLSEGKGLTRPGAVAVHLQPYGRNEMYGGAEKINKILETTNWTNMDYLESIANKYAPLSGMPGAVVPPQTPEGEEDKFREDDGTKLTKDWTWHNIISVNPDDYAIANPIKLWLGSSEGKAAIAEGRLDFDEWADGDYENAKKQLASGPFAGKELHWVKDLGITYNSDAADWRRAKAEKEAMWKVWAAENKVSKAPTLNKIDVAQPQAAVSNVLITGDDDPVEEDPTEQDYEDMVDDFFAASSDEDVGALVGAVDDWELEDASGTNYGLKKTSGTGKQLNWG